MPKPPSPFSTRSEVRALAATHVILYPESLAHDLRNRWAILCRGFSHCVPVFVKIKRCSDPGAYWKDGMIRVFEVNLKTQTNTAYAISSGKSLLIPDAERFGAIELLPRAPGCYKLLTRCLAELETAIKVRTPPPC